MTRTRGWLSLVALIVLSVGMPRQASATWSIVAVDPRTREVGAAGASCTPFVVGIVGLAPGRGAIVVQAASNPMARVRGVEMLNEGAAPAAIVRALREPQFDPENQQYGVAALGADSGSAYTGTQAFAESAIELGPGVAIQGNTLPSKEVVHAALTAFRAAADSGKPLAERLLRALEAGSAAGGDRRCGRQTAHSAFLGVARPGDEPRRPYIRLIIPDQEESGINPVQLLRREYERWRAQAGVAQRSTGSGSLLDRSTVGKGEPMLSTHRVRMRVPSDRRIVLENLPFDPGADVEIIVLANRNPEDAASSYPLRRAPITYQDPTGVLDSPEDEQQRA